MALGKGFFKGTMPTNEDMRPKASTGGTIYVNPYIVLTEQKSKATIAQDQRVLNIK